MKLSDERLKELAGPVDEIVWTQRGLLEEAHSLAVELKERRARERWIPVSEKLPDHNNLVLAIEKGGFRRMAYFSQGKWWHVTGFELQRVRGWRFLPPVEER